LEDKLLKKNIRGMVITGTKNVSIENREKYSELFYKILERTNEITVEKDTYPSCSGCPMGCSKSRIGEIGGNTLVHSLVACTFAKNIYSNIGAVFSCLNVLGYDYTHEDIEQLPALIDEVLENL
jgi:aldehyde:ferredoxin oxidoreductase